MVNPRSRSVPITDSSLYKVTGSYVSLETLRSLSLCGGYHATRQRSLRSLNSASYVAAPGGRHMNELKKHLKREENQNVRRAMLPNREMDKRCEFPQRK